MEKIKNILLIVLILLCTVPMALAEKLPEIAKTLNKNLETVKKSVQSLVKRGFLKKLGSTKSAWYEKL